MATKDADKEIRDLPSRIKPIEANPPPALKHRFAITVVLTLAAYAGAYPYFSAPRVKITSPKPDAATGRIVEITGFTKNNPVERKYIWVAA